jgi:hypothetical protein
MLKRKRRLIGSRFDGAPYRLGDHIMQRMFHMTDRPYGKNLMGSRNFPDLALASTVRSMLRPYANPGFTLNFYL